MTRAALLAAALLGACAAGACSRPAPITTCADSLHGVWRAEHAQRWMFLDRGVTLEGYPLFADAPREGDPQIVVAPRVIDLQREPDGLRGTVHRRYMRGAERCDARVGVRITSCAADQLELVLAEPAPPTGFAPCAWPQAGASRRERWRRD